jgi:DNA transformation protein
VREPTGFAGEVHEALRRALGPVVGKPMFGGAGFYVDGAFFALVHKDRVWFRVDEGSRAEYEARGMEPFRPFATRRTKLGYYELPPDVLGDARALERWGRRAVEAARAEPAGSRAAGRKRSTRRRPTT